MGYSSTKDVATRIYICSYCDSPTYFTKDKDGSIMQFPSPAYGNKVESLKEEIRHLYNESRNCMAVNAYTAAVMACRKILMHVAVDKGDKPNKSFREYVDYLSSKYISPENKPWVDFIRDKGNDANHEIPLTSKEDAEQLIDFTEMLLKLIYEYPSKIPGKAPQGQQNT